MAIDFPNPPQTNGTVFTSGNRSWTYNSTLSTWDGGLNSVTGTLIAQNANAVNITGGSITGLAALSTNNVTIRGIVNATGGNSNFTSVSSNNIIAGSGTLASPSITVGSAGNGIYAAFANNITFGTQGAVRLYVGNTITSTAAVEVPQGAISNLSFRAAQDTSTGLYFGGSSAKSLSFVTNQTTKMIILSSGNVGIGTATPTEKLTVSGNLSASGNIVYNGILSGGTNTFTKAGYAAGDILLDNGGTDSPGVLFYSANNTNYGIDTWNDGILQQFRFTKNLNEAGGTVMGYFDPSANFVVNGYLNPIKWKAGQVVNDVMLSNTDLTINNTTVATSTSDTILCTYSYTPISTTSYLAIHFHVASYDASGGTGNDSWFSRILVDGTEISWAHQSTLNGNRSGVLFPLLGRYTNSTTSAKSITIGVRRDTADDSITVTNNSTSIWMRITEIAR